VNESEFVKARLLSYCMHPYKNAAASACLIRCLRRETEPYCQAEAYNLNKCPGHPEGGAGASLETYNRRLAIREARVG